MSLSRLLPKSAAKKQEEIQDDLLLLILVDWGWSWQQLKQTPLPVLLRLLKAHEKRERKNNKKTKKK